MTHEQLFIDECRFAKIVSTPTGDGILIGGRVFYITAPEILKGDLPLNFTHLISRALRGGNVREVSGTAIIGGEAGKAA